MVDARWYEKNVMQCCERIMGGAIGDVDLDTPRPSDTGSSSCNVGGLRAGWDKKSVLHFFETKSVQHFL